jgi:O-antigen ligase
MVMGAARGSVVSLLAATAFAMVFLPQIRSRIFKWQAIGIALGLFIYAIVLYSFEAGRLAEDSHPVAGSPEIALNPETSPTVPDDSPAEEASGFFNQSIGRPMAHTSGRTRMWRSTLRDVKQHPLVGIGPMNYSCTSPKRMGHPHNFPLQLAAEWGIPVALAVSLLTFILLVWATRYIRQTDVASTEENQFAGLLLTGALAAACHATLSGVMVMPASQTVGILTGGLLLGILQKSGPVKPKAPTGLTIISGLVLTVGLLVLGQHELGTMKDRSVLLKPGFDMRPRIWQDSKVCSSYTIQNEVNN